jgi:hypothetical protein
MFKNFKIKPCLKISNFKLKINLKTKKRINLIFTEIADKS